MFPVKPTIPPSDSGPRPIFMTIALVVVGIAAFAVLAFLDAGALRPRTVIVLDAARCPNPGDGQVLVVSVPPESAKARIACRVVGPQQKGEKHD